MISNRTRSLLYGQQTPEKPQGMSIADLLPLIGAIGGSVVPGLGTIVGGALGSAAGTVAKQGIKKTGFDAKEIAKEAALGGAGGVLGKGLSAGARALGMGGKAAVQAGGEVAGKGALTKAGLMLSKGAIKPKVASGVGSLAKEEGIIKGLTKLGIKGTPNQMRSQISKLDSKLSGEIGEFLAKQKAPVSSSALKTSVSKALKGNMLIDETDPQIVRYVNQYLNRLGKAGKSISPTKLFEFKQDLNSQLSQAFKKIGAGGTLTPAEEVGLTVRSAIDDVITKSFPTIKQKTLTQSLLRDAIPGLEKAAATQFKIPLLGVPVPGVAQGAQAVGSRVGGGLLNAGERMATPPSLINQLLGQGLGQSALRPGAFAQPGQPTEEAGFAGADQLANFSLPASAEEPGSDITDRIDQAIMADLEETGGENVDRLLKLANYFGSKSEKKMSAAQEKASGKINDAEAIADQITQEISGLGIGSRAAGIGRKVAGTLQLDPNAAAYESLRQASIGPLARAISGEVGVLTDRDIKRAEGLLPKLTDSPAVINKKLKNLRQAIANRRKTAGGSQEPSQDDQIALLLQQLTGGY